VSLLGRGQELAVCRATLSGGRADAVAVVIAGPAGIGKTTLWRAVADSFSADALVLRTTGLPGAQAALGNLADLLDPVAATVLAGLPSPQAAALRVALGLAAPGASLTDVLPERAVLGVLSRLAPAGVVVAIDDEQWVDADTRRLLEIAAARLSGAAVRWLVAVRSGHAGRGLVPVLEHELGPRLTRVDLAGLDDTVVSELILSRFPGQWSPGLLRRVVTLAAGNPYTAVEVARETVASGGRDGPAARLPSALAESLHSRLARLTPQALAVVQAAALAGKPTRPLLRALAGEPAGQLVDEALEADVLEATPPDPVLRFSHPLLREAAERMLTGPQRRRLHRAIGASMDDPHEAAWHLACGADEPDEALARRVDRAVQDASARGAPARAAALARAAAGLTPDPDSHQAWYRRVVWLDRLATAGEYEQVRRLGEKWAVQVPAPLRGQLTALRAFVEADLEVACALHAEAFRDLAGRDPARAAQVGSENMLILGGLLGRLGEARECTAAVVAEARTAGSPVVLRQVLATDAFLAALAGDVGAGDRLRDAVRLAGLTSPPDPYVSPETGRVMWNYPNASPETALATWHLWRGELDPARHLLQAVFTAAERDGSDESAASARLHLAEVEWRAGNWDAAAEHAAAAARWDRESVFKREGATAYVVSLVEAGRGDLRHAQAFATRGLRAAEAQRDWMYAAQCRWVLGQIELSVDDPAAALRWLEPIADMLQTSGIAEPGRCPFTPDLIEAWAAVGHLGRASGRLAWLQGAARRLDHPWARITSGRAEAVLHLAERDPAAAIRAVIAVIPEARQRQLPFELGRCLLVLGTAQRKARQRRDAAASLDEAGATFGDLGAPRWQALAAAQRARLAPGRDADLTPAERRIAELAASGHSNPEIAATLFISSKTVEANLTRIYRKLGIRGRVDLARHSRPSRPALWARPSRRGLSPMPAG
jgi:DNA-binding CsgD family transcriptional regulator